MMRRIQRRHHYLAVFLTALTFVLIQCIIELVFIYTAISYSIDIASSLYAARYVLIAFHIALTVWLIVFGKTFAERFYAHH